MQARFSERPDKQPGPVYTIGATYVCRSRRFSRVHSCAGELVLRMIFDNSDRSLIARFDSKLPLRLLSRDREAIDLEPNEIVVEAE